MTRKYRPAADRQRSLEPVPPQANFATECVLQYPANAVTLTGKLTTSERTRDTSQHFETGIGRKLEGPDAEKQVYRVGFKYFLGAVVSKVPPGCSIEVFLDKTEEFAPGAFEYFKERRKGYKYPDGQTLQSLDFVDSAKEPAIQAADLYAHVAARQLNGHQKDPRRQRVWKALCEENTPHLMDYQSFRQQLDPIEQWDRQFNIDWGFPPDHESAF